MPTNAGISNSAHFLATLQISPAFQGLTSLAKKISQYFENFLHFLRFRREKAKSLHLAISSLQAHFLFLRLDWATSPGLPCQGYSTTVALTSTYRQLAHYWEVLVCLFSTHLASNQLVNEEEQEENTRTVVNERTHRRAECQSRRTRDCLVLTAAATVLRRLTRLLSETTR